MPGFSFALGRRKTTTAKVHPAPRKSKSPLKIDRSMVENYLMKKENMVDVKGGKTRRRKRTRRRR